jgi:predicted kinase
MNKCYQLIGVPGSGKSTWIKNQTWALGMPVVSTDFFVEAEAHRQGKTYTEVFESYMPTAVNLMVNQVLVCQANKLDFIWDQTSTTVASRKRKFNTLLASQYEHIAVVFKVPEPNELTRRLMSRPGKEVPADVMENMIRNFELPSMDEGFKQIWVVGE